MSAHKRRRMDPVQAIKGLPGWKVQTNPEDVLNATNKSSLTNGIGPIAQLKLQIREVHDLPEYFLLGAIVLQTCPATIQHVNVVLNTTTQENIIPWLTVKTARKLLGVGAIVSVDGTVVNDISTSTGTVESPPNTSTIVASTLNLTGVVPTTPYLARLLCLPIKARQLLFGSTNDLINLTIALRPCSIARCTSLLHLCSHAKATGHQNKLFKNKQLAKLCQEICRSQGWSRGPRKKPPTSTRTWEALLRLERRWCTESDGDDESCQPATPGGGGGGGGGEDGGDDDHHQHLMYGTHDVDPSLNIPNPNDAKRLKYINERKRPQVKWMVDCAMRLLNTHAPANGTKMNSSFPIRVVDVGGGRGDLAMAVAAAFLAMGNNLLQVHVTVIDINQQSLDAGCQRAKAAGLAHAMSFVLCDVTDSVQVEELLLPNDRVGAVALVFGLHCCGGLTEAAIELAMTARCHFCVCSCCFCSNPMLNTLSRRADEIVKSNGNGTGGETGENTAAERLHIEDRKIVATLASSTTKQEGQHRAMRAINALRLAAAKAAFVEGNAGEEKTDTGTGTGTGTVLETHQETFSSQFSVQNRVLVGRIK